MTDNTSDNALAPELRELIDRRTSLQQWLTGLDEQRGVASERVLQRVREDYEARLAATNAELAEHESGIRSEVERAAEQAAAAERVHEAALDALEEGRLRRAIGEIPADGWTERERELLEAVQSAKIAEDEARITADRFRELLGILAEERSAVQVAETSPEPVAEVPAEPGEPTAVEESAEAAAPPPTVDSDATVESGSSQVEEAVDGIPEQLPVAVEAEIRSEAPGLFDHNEIPTPEKKPPPGLKCPECGYTNDLSAWFCGVCGADVG